MSESSTTKNPTEIVAQSIASDIVQSGLASQEIADTIKSHLLKGVQNKTIWLNLIQSETMVQTPDSPKEEISEPSKTQDETEDNKF